MPHSELSIQCSNLQCQTLNDLKSRFCHKCKTPVIKRYLWATEEPAYSDTISNLTANSQLQTEINSQLDELAPASVAPQEALIQATVSKQPSRYINIKDRIYLDTQPGKKPQTSEQLSSVIVSYLQLFSRFPHVPQVYGQLDDTDVWLLDYGTIPLDKTGQLIYEELLPEIATLWTEVSPLKQLNWLRQIATLWQPLLDKKVASTLLNPQLIKINGSLVQLLELEVDGETAPSLADLGQLWQQWATKSNSEIQDVLQQLSDRMIAGSINQISLIISILDRALELYAQTQEYSYQTFAVSDSGPTRSNNQDTAYPNSEVLIKAEKEQQSLAIVCDGVGGHEGGEIASQETVNYLSKSISAMEWNKLDSPSRVIKKLIELIGEANNIISQRNDSEKRQERQRMGTTLVMALARAHQMYLTHVGDSRIYLITSNSCHQITVDDDLASREVRLGYAVYQDAVRYPSGGALIQALGMRDSAGLHTNTKRLIIDDECLLLLCSDGLSDFDRVEQYWRDILVPVLKDKTSLPKAVQTLIKVGNKKNGHDNVTVALIHCQVKKNPQTVPAKISWSEIEATFSDFLLWTDQTMVNKVSDKPKIEVHTAPIENTPAAAELNESEPPSQLSDVKKKSLLLPIIMTLSTILLVGVGFWIYNQTQKNNSRENSVQSSSSIKEEVNRLQRCELVKIA